MKVIGQEQKSEFDRRKTSALGGPPLGDLGGYFLAFVLVLACAKLFWT